MNLSQNVTARAQPRVEMKHRGISEGKNDDFVMPFIAISVSTQDYCPLCGRQENASYGSGPKENASYGLIPSSPEGFIGSKRFDA